MIAVISTQISPGADRLISTASLKNPSNHLDCIRMPIIAPIRNDRPNPTAMRVSVAWKAAGIVPSPQISKKVDTTSEGPGSSLGSKGLPRRKLKMSSRANSQMVSTAM
ncbi:MAG: hypothetical protein F4232_04115 [Acidimicrobiaceae bacterium]|nr:hypothetical protein [Acidimicrobiaceae bacterium]